MTYTAEASLASRIAALILSAAIHAALGFALFFTLPAGSPDAGKRRGERGDVLVVELLPLPDGGSPGRGDRPQDRARLGVASPADRPGERPDSDRPGLVRQPGSPPRGDTGDAETGGSSGLDASRNGAPALSGAEVQAFRSRLLSHIERFRRYPPEARAAAHEGVVRVQFVMDRNGNVTEAWVEQSSGSAFLDREAVAAVLRAQPLPAPPDNWPRAFGVALPIGFTLQ